MCVCPYTLYTVLYSRLCSFHSYQNGSEQFMLPQVMVKAVDPLIFASPEISAVPCALWCCLWADKIWLFIIHTLEKQVNQGVHYLEYNTQP